MLLLNCFGCSEIIDICILVHFQVPTVKLDMIDVETKEGLPTDQSSSDSGHGSVDSGKRETEESRRNRKNTRETEERNASRKNRDRKLSVTISEDGSKYSWRNEYALSGTYRCLL